MTSEPVTPVLDPVPEITFPVVIPEMECVDVIGNNDGTYGNLRMCLSGTGAPTYRKFCDEYY